MKLKAEHSCPIAGSKVGLLVPKTFDSDRWSRVPGPSGAECLLLKDLNSFSWAHFRYRTSGTEPVAGISKSSPGFSRTPEDRHIRLLLLSAPPF